MRMAENVTLVLVPVALALTLAACSSDEGKPIVGGPSTSSGALPVDDAGDGGGGSTTGKKKNAEVGCTKNEDCESNVCFSGNAQSFCTVTCTVQTAPTVCVAPFTGSCNNRGFCKRD